MTLGEPLDITSQIARVLTNLDILYMIGGSLASSLYGIPRATQDIDIVVDLKADRVDELVNSFKKNFFIDKDLITSALKRFTSFNMIHLKTMFKVDVFILKQDPHSIEEMARRRSYQISEEQDLYVASAEDIIIHKLYWYRLGNKISDRQWLDAIGVLKVQGGNLDFDYLKKAAHHRKVSGLLEQAIEESGS